ncbi:MAG: tetratricopeptide repeat protein [Deltaproteobacteria bacterium]|nr:tetratricopeptide repeat protein [Deltaproteobacteria bacterium]
MTRTNRRKRWTLLALGAVGLAGAVTVAAVAAPARKARLAPVYTPTSDIKIVARVAARDPSEVAARQALASSPENVELAVQLARSDIARYRTLSDPRYLGRAQATLARWWKLSEPPHDVLLLRATILQSTHEFTAARADLDRIVNTRPDDAQAHLTRAVVATITADYAAARASCDAVARLAPPLVAATCVAPLDGIAGKTAEAYPRLGETLSSAHGSDPAIRGWALTALAELALQLGDHEAAARHLRDALVLDGEDAYARNLLADILMDTDRVAEASQLLAGRDAIDSHLVRRAIAEHQLRGPEAPRLAAAMRDQIAAAAARGDRIHLREEARFALAVDGDAARAVQLARANWDVQKELADARLLAETAAAARAPEAAAPVIAWARGSGVRDAWLERSLARLGVRLDGLVPAPVGTR